MPPRRGSPIGRIAQATAASRTSAFALMASASTDAVHAPGLDDQQQSARPRHRLLLSPWRSRRLANARRDACGSSNSGVSLPTRGCLLSAQSKTASRGIGRRVQARAGPAGSWCGGVWQRAPAAELAVTLGFDVGDERANQRNPAAERLGERRQRPCVGVARLVAWSRFLRGSHDPRRGGRASPSLPIGLA